MFAGDRRVQAGHPHRGADVNGKGERWQLSQSLHTSAAQSAIGDAVTRYPAVAWTGAVLAGTGVVTTIAAMRLHRAAGASRVIATSATYDLADAEAAPDPSHTTH